MINDLETLTITNFRSIRGTISVPLAAPIVLIHGSNGAGKTSVLSALELAMTGDVVTMRREDNDFLNYLVHEGTERAEVTLSGGKADSRGRNRPGAMAVIDGQITGRALLDRSQAEFFAERCYLAQSVLSRLLEIYQHADPHSDSPLTRFVKDLLGLDQLDALVDGLHDAGDIRRTRNLVPEFRAAEERCKTLRGECVAIETERDRHIKATADQRKAFVDLIATLPPEVVGSDPPLADWAEMKFLLERAREDPALVLLAQHRRELASIRGTWTSLPKDASATERVEAEIAEASAFAAASAWRETVGARLETLLEQLRASFPDLPSWASTSPQRAYDTAVARLQADLDRLNAALARDHAAGQRVQEVGEEIQKAEARIRVADDQINSLAENAGELARALAGITPHIHGQDCPVCGRDFSEVSAEPLAGLLQQKIAALTEQAGRLSALSQAKSAEITRSAALQRERETEASKQLRPADRLAHQGRVATLASSLQVLSELKHDVAVGNDFLTRHSSAQRRLSEARDRDRVATELRSVIETLCAKLGQVPLDNGEPLPAALHRLEEFVASEERRLTDLQGARASALTACIQLMDAEQEARKASAMAQDRAAELQSAEEIYNAADARRLQAKAVGQAARDARTAIVRRVFNESLNTLWRDLFVRLAPTEPFVPVFRLPETVRGVVAALETLHRSGLRGGTPGTMLSAGNLNTAALTLFLALHLAVKPRVPWLVLDDSVQSMDEVHIAQFAALLRTLSKAHGRKVIIAVHDRSLFDYLALELSPAFADDQLITVELSRSASEATIANPRFWTYQKDEAIAA